MAREPKSQRQRRSDAIANRELLLQAACALAAEKGPEALSVTAVAQRAGLNRTTAYQHFRDQQALLDEVYAHYSKEFAEIFGELKPFGEHVDFYVGHFLERPDVARMWIYRLLQGELAQLTDFQTGSTERLARSRHSVNGIDAEMLAVISGTAMVMWSLIARARSDDKAEVAALTRRFTREFKRLYLHGVLRPDHWPALQAELSGAAPDGAGGED